MSETNSGHTQRIGLISAIAGVIAFLALMMVAGYSTAASLIVAVLVAVLVGILLWIGWYEDDVEGIDGKVSDVTESVADVAPEVVETPAPAVEDVKETVIKAAPETVETVEEVVATPAAKPVAKAKAAAKAPVAKDGKPELLTAARDGGADDLKQIKGVGPKLEIALNEGGIYHLDQIAGLRKKEVEWLNETFDLRGRIEREGWIAQAKALVKKAT